MRLIDRALPAVEHLVGEHAIDLLREPVRAAGGTIESVRAVHVQYRPGSDVVVRYSAQVSWSGRPAVRETLVAASTINGPLPGTVVVTTDTAHGPLDIGVWRWPFDPILTGLDAAVSAPSVASMMGLVDRTLHLDVVAYRPTERAVVRVVDPDIGAIAYIKVVAPSETVAIASRHRSLVAVGFPAPRVVASDEAGGLLVLEPIVGPTLRELIKAGTEGWVPSHEFDRLADRLALAPLAGAPLPSRLGDAVLHAHMLGVVVPKLRGRLDELIARFDAAHVPASDTTVHGDLHEGQLIVRDRRVVGVVDIDDVGPGAPIDDRANVLARLTFRSTVDAGRRAPLEDYAEQLRTASLPRFDADQLDLHTSAALVGLATGPFRMQGLYWRDEVTALVDRALMKNLSPTSHEGLTRGCA